MAQATMFGLAVRAPFEISGVHSQTPDAGAPRPFELSMATRAAVLAARPVSGCDRLSDRRDSAGRSVIRVDQHPTAGTFIVMRGEGAFRIAADARSAQLAPVRRPAWRWQRSLVGQVLPFAAVLNGLEVLHAAAVEVDGRAVAIVGGSHSGKSTLATTLLARGAALVADDVVTLEQSGGGPPTVHPGPPLISMREGTRRLLGGKLIDRLGVTLGFDEDGARVSAANHRTASLPLGGLVVMNRDLGHELLDVTRRPAPDPRLILGSTFNFVVRTPERLTAHLDLASRIAATVPVVTADVGAGHTPTAVADAILRELGMKL